ncbi:N-acetyl-gamma-glutamyl-phosphate reductase [Geothermobacter ehrlichii]|uniref:N-acetyl-gamma-glutamyl-phosphate reductase n=1 Tax=Geothermobacter ehrlichii TaxID=213224 RepID=A0A5D3WLG4_9BACT|nr:N-acetyl-gamma-glutamyl-phosphate reductase [Geothermobacter ehrlichii]TYO99552.1 N-acetyl-gamma-glutamyl-phosphate reductase [Geothermobacter ehrlichii]
MKKRVAVLGGSGYTGVELLRLLASHPKVELVCVTSRQFAGQKVENVFPSLRGMCGLEFTDGEPADIAGDADVVFTALPHQAAMGVVPELLQAGLKVVDLSADYRLRDAAVYEEWYQPHSSPQLLKEAVYGLPELFRDDIRQARLVANPGCYPTSVALGLAPLLKDGLIAPDSLIIDSKSGTSGAGRSAKLDSLFCEVNEGFKAYGLPRHRHTPEIEQTLGQLAGQPVKVSFTPHLLPVNRGILSTLYATLLRPVSQPELDELYARFYQDEFFVRCTGGVLPNIRQVVGSNFCDVGAVVDGRTGRVVVVSVIDNLLKGAAGQAVQNFNLLLGLDETTGLEAVAVWP